MISYFWNGKITGLLGAAHLIFRAGLGKINDKISTYLAYCSFHASGKSMTVNSGVVYRYPGNIKVGDNVVLARGAQLYSENPKGSLQISNGVVITFNVRLDFSGDLKIGENTLISKNCVIETHDHGLDPFSKPIFKSLTIEENVWIGMNSIILSGVNRIGANSVIAAGSVVTKEVPPNVIIGGVPARIIKSI